MNSQQNERIPRWTAGVLILAWAGAVWAADGATSETKLDFPMMHNIGVKAESTDSTFKQEKEWTVSKFHGKGNVRVADGTVFLDEGHDLTGITWVGPLVRMNYEITLEAMRVGGDDFFCGLTFPYGKDPCSLIVGGWGGTCVGISCLDYEDAYNNETARFITFEKNRWYKIRLRVTESKIEAWIDGDQIVDVATKGRKIDIRFEVEASVPLGIASWRTSAAIRNVHFQASLAQIDAPSSPETKPSERNATKN